MTTGGFTIT